jgi:murein DD-endopeptidase MepM/ murein hydrolase activator NlpD
VPLRSVVPAVPRRSPQARAGIVAGAVLAAAATIAATPATAAGSDATGSGGGATFFETPTISKVVCLRRCASQRRVQGGSTVRVAGRWLDGVTEAIFHGTTGSGDDVRTTVEALGAKRLKVRVPRRAVTGPLSLRTANAVESGPMTLAILPPLPPGVLSSKRHVFPIRGKHDFGGAGARYGTGRSGHSHQGHDVFARCGTPLVAARGGKVQFKRYHAAAGYYMVIDGDGTGVDYAYMHMAEPSPFKVGDKVATGQRIGSVGDSGNARGCHLHFELWSAPGWYQGGHPFDPLRPLKAWDSSS